MIKPRGDLPFGPSPYPSNSGQWAAIQSVVLGPISPSVAGAIARTTRQAGATQIIDAPFAWVYDVELWCEKWVTATGTDPALTIDVVVESGGLLGTATGATYAATAGNPFANTTDFASLLTANINAFGTTQPTLFNIAYNGTQTFNMGYFSARYAAAPLMKAGSDPFLSGMFRDVWKDTNLQNRSGETMFPVLKRGQALNLRLITAAGGAGNTVTNLYAVVKLIPSDRPFDGQ